MHPFPSSPCCDAVVGTPGARRGCRRPSAVSIVTVIGSVLHYCDAHRSRVNDPERRYHAPVVATFAAPGAR